MQTSRLVVCEGKTMVSDAECEEKALAWCKLVEGTVSFTLPEETEVSLGIIVNLTGQSSFGINAFKLEGVTIEPLTPEDPTGIRPPQPILNSQFSIFNSKGVYDLSGRMVNPQSSMVKAAIKREESDARINSPEREQARRAASMVNGLKKGVYIKDGKKLLQP